MRIFSSVVWDYEQVVFVPSANAKAMIGMLIKSVELNIIIGWSSKFMEVKSIVMQFRGIMTAAIVVFICREPSVDDAIGSIM